MKYRITLYGKHIKTNQTYPLESIEREITSKLNIGLGESRKLNAKIPIHKELFEEISNRFGSEFKHNEFSVTDIYVI